VALHFSPRDLFIALAAVIGKIMLLSVMLAVSETAMAKMRLFRVPHFLGLAFILSLIGILSHVILEVN
jgi:formate hydrogenlyase subunit 4